MVKKLMVAAGLVVALGLPAGVAVAQETQSTVPACVHDGTGQPGQGPADGTGMKYGQEAHQQAGAAGAGYGQGVRDGTGPIHEGPADGTGMQYGRNAR